MKKIIMTTLPLVIASNVYAGDTSLSLSYVKTNGNTDSSTFNAVGKTKQKIDDVRWYDAKIDAQYGKTNNDKTSDKYELGANYNRTISNALYYYVGLSYKDDKFSGYDYRASIGPGLGYSVLKDDVKTLDVKAGIAYSKDKLDNGTTDSYASGNTEASYTHKINDSVDFTQDLKYIVSFEDSDNYTLTSESALKVKMTDKLSLGTSYKVEYTNKVPTGTNDTDTKFLTSLIINF